MKKVINYTPSSYSNGSFGGLARFDYELKKVFPDLISMPRGNTNWGYFNPSDYIIISDHTYVLEIPIEFKAIAVHHGMADIHKQRNENWPGDIYVNLQSRMKDRPNTWFVGISKFTQDSAKKLHNIDDYAVILHGVDTESNRMPEKGFSVVGDWRNESKGEKIIKELRNQNTMFTFNQLSCGQYEKTSGYINHNIYLCLSVSEGNSYSMMDAIACGLPVLSTNVGLFYGDNTDILGEVIDWNQRNNISLILDKLMYIYHGYERYNPKKWLQDTIPFDSWILQWQNLVKEISSV
jgi:glycosyltransferase involved in cell wall biosynthesis